MISDINNPEENLEELKKTVEKIKKIYLELQNSFSALYSSKNTSEKRLIQEHIKLLSKSLNSENKKIPIVLEEITLIRTLTPQKTQLSKIEETSKTKKLKQKHEKSPEFSDLERKTIDRIKSFEKTVEEKKLKKPSSYIKFSNAFFSDFSNSLIEKGYFKPIKRDLVKSNMNFLPRSYVSVIFFTTLISFLFSIFIVMFFSIFALSPLSPFISAVSESFFSRFGKIFWLMFLIPLVTYIFMYFYPSMERKSLERKINQELPFAAIHMSSISGSMVDPSKIFSIMIATGDYLYLEKEFIKLLNEMNILGYDMVAALRNTAFNSPSKKLAELFNGIAVTISSGGNLPDFFNKRAQSLLFDYRIEREKYTRSAETFMDIYISVVIAAPMILMLLLMIMKISGLGISLTTSALTLIMVLGVSLINVAFLVFLQLKQEGV